MNVKPIPFNTDMVRATLANLKTVTRRVVKGYALEHLELDTDGSIIGVYDQFEGHVRPVMDYAPYRPGDVLYVRETWSPVHTRPKRYLYKADAAAGKGEGAGLPIKWHPSIHMPREAARIFLRVTDVRVERLQDITEEQAIAEGTKDPYEYQEPEWYEKFSYLLDKYQIAAFAGLWESALKPTDRALYGWGANPWVWVIEFERCEKPEADS